MRNSNPTQQYRNKLTMRCLNAAAILAIALWCQQSQANTGLWLWGWLGVSEIQIMQDPSGANATKDVSPGATKVVPPTKFSNDPIRKINTVSKVPAADSVHTKDTKDRPVKITIM